MRGAVAYPSARPWTPLALTLGLHLLLVLVWLAGARGDPGREPASKPPPASVLVLLRPPSLPRAQPEPPSAAAQPSLHRVRPVPRAARAATAAAATPAPAVSPPTSDAAASTDVQAVPAQADTAPTALPGDLLARSKAMAGRVDRELRKGASPITAEPERKWERFADAFAAARKDGSRTVTLDSYTAPDGVIVYRKTVGGRVSCYRSGSVGGLVTGFGSADGHGAGNTTCPTGVSWTRH
jgi:hypothetical protein